MNLKTSLFAVYLLSIAGIAQAGGAVFRIEVEDVASGGEVEVTEMKVDGNRMRTDSGGKNSMTMIFLGATDEMYIVDHKDKSYIVMDRETLERLANQMSAMKQMEEAMKNVPPEQREMMERMMKGKMKGMPSSTPRSEPVVKSVGKSDSVNLVSRDDVVELKTCVSNWTAIQGGDELRQISLEMKDFASALVDAMGSVGFGGTIAESPMTAMEMAGGFPLITENFNKGSLSRRSRFQLAEAVAIPDDQFMPPSGYKKKDMGGMAR